MDAPRQPLDIYDRNAPRLLAQGYHPIPVAPLGFETKKCPARWDPHTRQFFKFKGWPTTAPVMDRQPGANIGVRLGKGLVALDYDHDEAALIISAAFPDTPVNKAGQRGWTGLYRVDADVPSEDFFNDDGELVLQILGEGKQTVIPPSIHPDTEQPYRWTNGHSLYDTAIESLPLLPADYRERILKLGFKTTRPSKERPKPDRSLAGSDQGEPDGPYAELNQVAIRNLAKWVPQLNIYKLRRRVGRFPNYVGVAQWRPSTEGRELEKRDLNLKISGLGIKDFGNNRGYSPLDLVMAARGTSLAEAFCWLEEKLLPPKEDIQIDLDKIMEAQDAPSIVTESDPGDDEQPKEPKRRRINPMPLILPAEKDIPRRQFLYGMHYMPGTVSGTIGTGGTGKSTLSLIEGMGMSIGRDLIGKEEIRRPLKVWYHNAEETKDELFRRCAAICKRHRFSPAEMGLLQKNFFITNGFETDIKVAKGGRDVVIDAALRREIIEVMQDLQIQVAIFDPLVAMHRVHEDFNSALDPVIRDAFGKIAHDTNCAIDLCHHTRKKPAGHDGEYTVSDSRGGQSFIDAVRGARVLNTMSKAEAANFDLLEDDRFDYMRLSRGKANMVRRGIIGWYHFIPVELDNGSEAEALAGDSVGVLERWDPPKDSDLVRQATPQDRQYWLGVLQYGEYRYDARSPEWFGLKIAERLGANQKDPKQMKVVAAILDDLIEEGTLQIEERRDEHRKVRQFIVPGVVAGVENL
jgi:hypothetical protein